MTNFEKQIGLQNDNKESTDRNEQIEQETDIEDKEILLDDEDLEQSNIAEKEKIDRV